MEIIEDPLDKEPLRGLFSLGLIYLKSFLHEINQS